MEKFQNKYRIPSARLKNWDYAANGAYFITICTGKRKHYFGNIENGIMHLSGIGEIAEKYWLEIPNHFPFIELGNFVVMPNHVHGILIINNPVETLHCNVCTKQSNSISESILQSNSISQSESISELESKIKKNIIMSEKSPKSGSISTIIRSYKSVVSKYSHIIEANFAWQERFHDHIIRNAESFERIQNYIAQNPKKWSEDKFYK